MNTDFAINMSWAINKIDQLKVFLVLWPEGDDARLVIAESKDQAHDMYVHAAHQANPDVHEFGLATVAADELLSIHGDILGVFGKHLKAVPGALDGFVAVGAFCAGIDDLVRHFVTALGEARRQHNAYASWIEQRIKALDAELTSGDIGEGFDPGKHFAAQAQRDAFAAMQQFLNQGSEEKAVSE